MTLSAGRLVRRGPDRYDVGCFDAPEYLRHGDRLISTLNGRTHEIVDEPGGGSPFRAALITDNSLPCSRPAAQVVGGDTVHLGVHDGADLFVEVLYAERDGATVLLFLKGMNQPVALRPAQAVPVVSRRS